MLNDLLYRLRALFHRNAVETELNEEIRFHFDNEVEKYRKQGMTDEEARRSARHRPDRDRPAGPSLRPPAAVEQSLVRSRHHPDDGPQYWGEQRHLQRH